MRRFSWYETLFRPDCSHPQDLRQDVFWLLGLAALLIATGIGLRDPWPADEPRFALIARDMVATGDWLIPRIGGDLYADKPPLYFWLMAAALEVTGSLRIAFLLPSLLSAIGCVLLVYDLARRLWNRETGLIAGVALLFTVQFVWQARQAQIDATLCFWTTLSLYGLLRHLLLGPRWRWYCIGWAAAGFGIITKGVGFLPLLVLIPYVLLRGAWAPRFHARLEAGWLLGPLALIAAVSVWLIPMLIAAQHDPALVAYRDEILFRQTITRFADAWHHREPFWYFLIEVIPWLWLPLTALLPWLVPQWRRAWRERDLRIALLMIWVVLVVVFFSLSSGKRGVYMLPAAPAFVLLCAPYLRDLAQRAAAQRALFAVTALVTLAVTLAIPYALVNVEHRSEIIEMYGLDVLGPLILLAITLAIVCAMTHLARGFAAFAAGACVVLLVVSVWANPVMNAARSGESFVTRVAQAVPSSAPLGLVAFKEQYLLQIPRPVVHFGHSRWREGEQEAMDAARWLAQSPTHRLVVDRYALERCFSKSERTALGVANRSDWFVVHGWADAQCVRGGKTDQVYVYRPPGSRSARVPMTRHELRRHTHEH